MKYHSIRGATLIHGMLRALGRILTYPWQLTYANTLQNTQGIAPLTAPSAVHLTTCFSPDSQRHRLSVKASLSLSPLQRFKYDFLYTIPVSHALVNGFKKIFPKNVTVQPCILSMMALALRYTSFGSSPMKNAPSSYRTVPSIITSFTFCLLPL